MIGPDEIQLYTNPAGEHRDFLDCVKSRKDPYFPVDIGHRVSTVCHLANIAIKLGRKLKWDPEQERFSDDDRGQPDAVASDAQPVDFGMNGMPGDARCTGFSPVLPCSA